MFATDDAAERVQAAWWVRKRCRVLRATVSLAGAAAAKYRLQALVEQTG